jgi:tetratricopeptide (TPR) repeat protein
LNQSLELAPDHPGLLRDQLAMLVQGDHFDEALEWLDAHAELERSKPELRLQRALVLERLGDRNEEAEQILQQVLSLRDRPDLRARAGYQLANMWVQASRLPQAEQLLRQLHEEFPRNEDIALAQRLIDEALKPKPNRPERQRAQPHRR